MVDKLMQQEDICVVHLRCLEEENRVLWYGKVLSKNENNKKDNTMLPQEKAFNG